LLGPRQYIMSNYVKRLSYHLSHPTLHTDRKTSCC